MSSCTMCGKKQPREQPQKGDRGSNPVADNQYLIFFLYGPHVLVPFFSFVNIQYFTWLTSFDLILLRTFFMLLLHYLSIFTENEAEII